MRVLALDTTTRAGSVAIVNDDDVVVERCGDPERSHTERLPTDILIALDASGLAWSDIDVYAIASGPGSFTGLRIGIATIQGLAFVNGKRVVPVSALAALAEAAADTVTASPIGVWMDAYRRDVFSALFQVGNRPRFAADRLIELDPPMVGDPSAILARWEAAGRLPAALAGDGAVLFAEMVPGTIAVITPPPLASIIGRMAVARARAGDAVDPAGVQPLYIRRPDVEVAREKARETLHHGRPGRHGGSDGS
jgi:tRNA threonylcarbamoyladenosine biosynthesis protein TsaB